MAVFSSGGPGNLATVYAVADALPDLLEVACVVTDRLGIPAVAVARDRGTPLISHEFHEHCGPRPPSSDASGLARYRALAERFHDKVLADLEALERQRSAAIDFVVLAYRRIIHGRLLERFSDRIINQHPADLARLDASGQRRLYPGISGLDRAIRAGEASTCTSTILIDGGVDTGEIVCQGPQVLFTGDRESQADIRAHELRQKCASDRPSLDFALRAIVAGRFSLAEGRHPDGCRVVCLDGIPLPYSGYIVSGDAAGVHDRG